MERLLRKARWSREQRVYWVSESLHVMTIVEMKKQSLSWELNSSVHEDERSVGKADDSVGKRKREVEQDTRASRKQEGFAGGCPGSHREGQGNSSLSSGLRDKLPKELKFHLLEKVQGKQRFEGHPGFIRKSHGKQTFQKSPEIKEEFDDHKLKIQRAQWKADFIFLFVNGAGRELTGACVETHK